MGERNVSELTTPLSRYTYATECRHYYVAEAFPEVKTHVGQLPHTIDTVDAFWFAQHIFKRHLKRIKL